MRYGVLLVTCLWARAQTPDLAHEHLTRAYEALRTRDYERAVAAFRRGIEIAPDRAPARKDLAYTYLKIGETESARDQFGQAMRLAPDDLHVAKEYAFLCHETRRQAEARRIFDRIRKTGDPVAEQAFQNIDAPLRDGIERWRRAIEMGADNFSAHFELATLAERRDELELAATHYERAWRLMPKRRNVLVDLGRVWSALGREEDANAALLAASRGGEARAAESARELLPARYPFVAEFRKALEFDPTNLELRRELGFLLLRMDRQDEAEAEFRKLAAENTEDMLSATQLGFLLHSRGDEARAAALFDRVMAGGDEELANRVRAVLRLPQVLRPRPEPAPAAIDAKLMAERSIKAGFMKDALKYLQAAHEADPADFRVMMQLGWTYNILKQDRDAIRWFDLARKSPDPLVAAEAGRAWRNLRSATSRIRTSGWVYPMFSSRWRDVFSYAQTKVEARTAPPLRPYLSMRLIGDTRVTTGGVVPQYLSESSVIAAVGLAGRPVAGATMWFEAGSAISYLHGTRLPDYRGGVAWLRGFGAPFGSEKSGWAAELAADGVFVSRFGNDFVVYAQNRAGWTGSLGRTRYQVHWGANLTTDSKGEYWANFVETGPGVRFRPPLVPESLFVTAGVMRGVHTINRDNPRRPNFFDVRVGVWYAFSR